MSCMHGKHSPSLNSLVPEREVLPYFTMSFTSRIGSCRQSAYAYRREVLGADQWVGAAL